MMKTEYSCPFKEVCDHYNMHWTNGPYINLCDVDNAYLMCDLYNTEIYELIGKFVKLWEQGYFIDEGLL